MEYLRDPDAIYRQSFATVRAEADLAGLPDGLAEIAVRLLRPGPRRQCVWPRK